MDKTKILIAAVVALLVLNSATLVFIWLQLPPTAALGPRPARDPGAILSQQLGFSKQQQQQFDVLRQSHHTQMIFYGDSLKHLKDSLFILLLNKDSVRARTIISSIGGIHQKVEQVTFDHFQQVRLVCTPKQRQEYDLMIKNAYLEVQRPSRDRAMNQQGLSGPPDQGRQDRESVRSIGQTNQPSGDDQQHRPPRPEDRKLGAPRESTGQIQMRIPPDEESGRPEPGRRPPGPPPNREGAGDPPPEGGEWDR